MEGFQTEIIGDKGTTVLSFPETWFYPEGKYNKEVGNVDGVAGATVKWEEGKGILL